MDSYIRTRFQLNMESDLNTDACCRSSRHCLARWLPCTSSCRTLSLPHLLHIRFCTSRCKRSIHGTVAFQAQVHFVLFCDVFFLGNNTVHSLLQNRLKKITPCFLEAPKDAQICRIGAGSHQCYRHACSADVRSLAYRSVSCTTGRNNVMMLAPSHTVHVLDGVGPAIDQGTLTTPPKPTRPHGRWRTATLTHAQYVSPVRMFAMGMPSVHPLGEVAGPQKHRNGRHMIVCRGVLCASFQALRSPQPALALARAPPE